jgi:alpha-tubulin suppressor-like RCC1 family protein
MATETGVWTLQEVRDKQLASEWTYEAMEPGPLFAMGGNANGQLGVNNAADGYSSPIQVPGTTWTRAAGSMSGYGQIMLATKSDNTLWGWGRNSQGALAQNDITSRSSPTQIGGTTWSGNFSAGLLCGMGVKTDGTLWSWGYGDHGNLGLNESGSPSRKSSPVQVGTDTDWSTTADQGAIGGNSTMAGTCIKTDGTLWAWGHNSYGVLGQNDRTQRSSPVQIPGTWTGSYISKPYHTFAAIKSDGTLWTWGVDSYGSLGHNNTAHKSSPTQVTGTNWRKIVSGNYGAIATKTDSTLWYMGSNQFGSAGQNLPMGPGGQNARSSPIQLGTATDWNDIALSMWTRYASKTNGELWGWGRGDGGSLFTPGIENANRSSPTQLHGGATDFTGSISACYGRALFNVRN